MADGAGRPVLLTVSGRVPEHLDEQVASGSRPRADYHLMQAAFDADVVDERMALAETGRLGTIIHRIAGVGALLGWYCFRQRHQYDVIVTDGEQVGLPFEILSKFGRRGARHMMITHILSVPKKVRLIRSTRIARSIDCYVVYCSWQADFLRDRLGVDSTRVLVSTFMVDTNFFSPDAVDVPRRRMICSAGLERRDYPTLISAVDGLDIDVVIAAASPWSKRSDSTAQVAIPDNVSVQAFDLFELRELYANSLFVVMPLEDVNFQAGITTILEAMAMSRPVICTRTPGQCDTIIDGETGVYTKGGDVDALRAAIKQLLDDSDYCDELGRAARDWTVREADIAIYAERLADRVRLLQRDTPS